MLGRYVLIILGLIAILWTGYVAIDLIDKKDELSPKVLFGLEDEDLLIVHRSNEIDWSAIDFRTSEKIETFWKNLSPIPSHVQSVYLSSQRDHILIETADLWSRKSIKALFKKYSSSLEFNGIHSFKVNGLNGKMYRHRLYLSAENFSTTPLDENWQILDKKSSASLLKFENEGFKLTDIYFKKGGKIEYVTKRTPDVKGRQVNDKNLFSHALPQDLQEYHFFEREFLSSTDQIFAKSPMYDWIDNGLVQFSIDGYLVVISDYKSSQDPVNTLFDFVKKDPENQPYGFFQNLELMKGFPAKPEQGFYAYSMDDFVVMSSNQQLCERIVADYKLGNTLIQQSEKTAEIFSQLPIRVSERYYGKSQPFSKSVYNGIVFQTSLPGNGKDSAPVVRDEEVNSFKMGGEIHDFVAQSGSGNLIAVTRSGLVKLYKNGTKQWERNLGSEPIGKIEQAKLASGDHWMITTKNGVHLLNKEGNSPAGFPAVAADKQLACNATMYTWKGKTGIVVANTNGDILVFDQNGKRNAVIKTGLSTVEQPVDCWVSNKKLYFGIRDNRTLKMIDAERKSEFRTISLPGKSITYKKTNEINLFTISNAEFLRIDQKGNKTATSGFQDFVIKSSSFRDDELLIALSSMGSIKIVNEQGQIKNSLKTNANDIVDISINFVDNGKTVLGIVDGLENDVYLYGLNGQVIGKKTYEGSLKCTVTNLKSGTYILTTIVDDFIVQYTVN